MGFLKKNRAKMPGEINSTVSKASSGVLSPSSDLRSAIGDEGRQDVPSSFVAETESRQAAPGTSREVREKVVAEAMETLALAPKSQKSGRKSSGGSVSVKKSPVPAKMQPRMSGRASARSRSTSIGRGRGRGRSVEKKSSKPVAKASSGKKSVPASAEKKSKLKAMRARSLSKEKIVGRPSSRASKSKASVTKKGIATEAAPKVTNGKKSNARKARASRRQQPRYDDESLSCSSDEDSYDVSYSYSHSTYESGTETEIEDSTMYTDATDFVPIGYNSTEDDDGSTSSDSATSGEHSFARKETRRKNSAEQRRGSPKQPPAKPAAADTIENGAEKIDGKGGDHGEMASRSSRTGSRGSRRTQATAATHREFLAKMDGFMVKDQQNQLMVQVMTHGNVEKLELQELSMIPEPNQPHEVIVKVDCSTITLQDCMIRRGKWYEMQSLPFVPGSDLVGTIYAMGDEAIKCSVFKIGDKIAAAVPSGGNAKYITLSYKNLIRVPNDTDSDVALCMSSTYVPAREALGLARKLNTPFTGANILVIGGNGPSGLATIELALLEGANVFTTADERHHAYLSALGAKCFPIDPSKWLPTLQGKMDVVLDSVCLDGYESSSLALNLAGTLVCTGMSAVYTQGQVRAFGMKDVRDYKAMYCKMRAKYILGHTVYYDRMDRFVNAPNEYAQQFRYLCHLASKDSIKPLVACRSSLNQVAATQRDIEHGSTSYGVCVCLPWMVKVDPAVLASSEESQAAF